MINNPILTATLGDSSCTFGEHSDGADTRLAENQRCTHQLWLTVYCPQMRSQNMLYTGLTPIHALISQFLSSMLVSYSSLQYAQHRQSKVKLLQPLHRPPSAQVSRSSSLRSSSSSSGALGTDIGEHDESDHCIHSESEE